jgi:copper(I)-binding protein
MGYHIMLVGLKSPLKPGDRFPMTLTFDKAGKVDVTVVVQDKEAAQSGPTAGAAPMPMPGAGHPHQH